MNNPDSYQTNVMICDSCSHKWVSVSPIVAEYLECPACGHMTPNPAVPIPDLLTDLETEYQRLRTLKGKRRIFPLISYCNFHRKYPQSRGVWKRWFQVKRYWSDALVMISIRHHQLTLDFRLNVLADLT